MLVRKNKFKNTIFPKELQFGLFGPEKYITKQHTSRACGNTKLPYSHFHKGLVWNDVNVNYIKYAGNIAIFFYEPSLFCKLFEVLHTAKTTISIYFCRVDKLRITA